MLVLRRKHAEVTTVTITREKMREFLAQNKDACLKIKVCGISPSSIDLAFDDKEKVFDIQRQERKGVV